MVAGPSQVSLETESCLGVGAYGDGEADESECSGDCEPRLPWLLAVTADVRGDGRHGGDHECDPGQADPQAKDVTGRGIATIARPIEVERRERRSNESGCDGDHGEDAAHDVHRRGGLDRCSRNSEVLRRWWRKWRAGLHEFNMTDRPRSLNQEKPPPISGVAFEEIAQALWSACSGAQKTAAQYLVERGTDISWVGWGDQTPLDVAETVAATDLARWLSERGAERSADIS